MRNKLTGKQEKFCQNIVSGMTQYEAYKDAYNVKPNTKRDTTDNNAYMKLQKSEIRARVNELKTLKQEKVVEKLAYTDLESFAMFKKLQEMAINKEDINNAIKAEIEKAKLSNLYVETRKLTIKDDRREIIDKAELIASDN